MSFPHEHPSLASSEAIRVSISGAFNGAIGRSTVSIRCLQWNETDQDWNVEEHSLKRTAEMSGLEVP